jgi:hypothetical protein
VLGHAVHLVGERIARHRRPGSSDLLIGRPSKKESVTREELLQEKGALRNPGPFKRSNAGGAGALLPALGHENGEDAVHVAGFNELA